MSLEVVAAPTATPPATVRDGSVEVAVARHAFRQLWIGAVVCGVAFGGTVASSAISYAVTFPTELGRQQLAAATRGDVGLSVLLGPIDAIDTIGGYAVYKSFLFLTTIGAIWAILAATRLLRGEEDSGRWTLVLAGRTRASRATAATLGALGAGIAVVFVLTTLIVLLACRGGEVSFDAGGTVVLGLSLVIVPAVFAAVGALTSQLGRTRRLATGFALGVFGVAYVLRMIGDAGPGTRWLLWLTPFGWAELMQPLTRNELWPLLPAVVAVVVVSGAAVVLAGRRDVGSGMFAAHDASALRPFGLRSPLGLGTRLETPVLAAWCVGLLASGLLLGIVAKLTITSSVPSSFVDRLQSFGVQGTFTRQYLGIAFLLVATTVALLPAGQLGAACSEETSGRLAHVLSRPITRTAWFAGRLLLAAAGVVVAAVLAGVGTWAGAVTQGVDVDLTTMIGAGLNVVPTALVVLGIGGVVLAVAPRAASTTVYALVIWSVLVDLLGSMITGLEWLDRSSLFHYMPLVPAQDAQPWTLAITTSAALLLCVAATVVFDRRDLRAA